MAACNAEIKNSHAALNALKDGELWSIRVEHRATPFIQETARHGHAET
jgi:hypothetical protein